MNHPRIVVAALDGDDGSKGDGIKEPGSEPLRHPDAAVRGGCARPWNVSCVQPYSRSGQAHPVGHGSWHIPVTARDGVSRACNWVDFFSH